MHLVNARMLRQVYLAPTPFPTKFTDSSPKAHTYIIGHLLRIELVVQAHLAHTLIRIVDDPTCYRLKGGISFIASEALS